LTLYAHSSIYQQVEVCSLEGNVMHKSSNTLTKKPICPSRLDLAQLLVEVTDEYSSTFMRKQIELEIDVPHSLGVDLDPIVMRDAFRKIIDNAIDAMPNGGAFIITSLVTKDGLLVEFADSGPGVSEELKQRLFEPFATTKHDHAGLGLAIVRDIIAAHHGSISVVDCPEGGAAFTIQLPLVREQRMAA